MFDEKDIREEMGAIARMMMKHPWHKFRCGTCGEVSIEPAAMVIIADKPFPCMNCYYENGGQITHQDDCVCKSR